VSSYDGVHRWSAADTVAGFLATLSIFASAIGVAYRPARIVPVAVVLALVAARMSERNQKLAGWAVAAGVACWTLGMTIAVLASHPLY
jgi:Co/Zn/Cd efflux system component